MTVWDYLDKDPIWALIYLVLICATFHSVILDARAARKFEERNCLAKKKADRTWPKQN